MADQTLVLAGSLAEEQPPVATAKRARALVLAHFDFVWRLLRRLGVPQAELDDSAQRVFVIATQRLEAILPERERSFLYGTALRVAAMVRRTNRRRQRWIVTRPADSPSLAPTPHEQVERREALAFLDEVLEGLADELREVFVLCEIEELTVTEVASIQGIPVGTVGSRLRRARKEFDDRTRRLRLQLARKR